MTPLRVVRFTTYWLIRLVPLFLTAAIPATSACDSTGPCCKVCSTGKACGDTCISASEICHAGSGCACNQ